MPLVRCHDSHLSLSMIGTSTFCSSRVPNLLLSAASVLPHPVTIPRLMFKWKKIIICTNQCQYSQNWPSFELKVLFWKAHRKDTVTETNRFVKFNQSNVVSVRMRSWEAKIRVQDHFGYWKVLWWNVLEAWIFNIVCSNDHIQLSHRCTSQ